jgi:hypothetical protein
MNWVKLIFGCLFFLSNSLYGQQRFSGMIIDKKSLEPIQYVNIGIVNQNIGTVSDLYGHFDLSIDSIYNNDSLKISCIGFNSLMIKVADFKLLIKSNIYLDPKITVMPEVVVYPKDYRQERLGITVKSKQFQAGFKENKLGYECGILIKNKKSAILETLHLNFGYHTFDTIFYRLNIYEVVGKMDFVNILNNPIYLKLPKDKINDDVTIDLKPNNLIVKGNFMITLEHVKDLGEGYLTFNSTVFNKTYSRKTSQGKWHTIPIGIGISVDSKVEK